MNEIIYYINVNGQQVGPLSKEGLVEAGMTLDSMVWRSDLPNWVEARTLPELVAMLTPAYEQPPQNPYRDSGVPHPGQYQQPSYSQPPMGQSPYGYGNSNSSYPRGTYPPGWKNWLGWAIAGTIFGSLFYCVGFVTGIIAIIFSALANSDAKNGNLESAKSRNSVAMVMTIITLVFAGIALLVILFYLIFVGSLLALLPY